MLLLTVLTPVSTIFMGYSQEEAPEKGLKDYYKDTLTSVTFWNISDRYSWLDNCPVRGRKNYPLLFDKKLQPKKAYYEVIDFEG